MLAKKRLLAIQLVGSDKYPTVLWRISTYRDGIFYVSSHLLSTGLYDIDLCQGYWNDSPMNYDLKNYDAILISGLGHQVVANRELLTNIRKEFGKNKPIIIGGPHATFAPYDALNYADFAVIGAGERPVEILLDRIFNGPYPTPDNPPDRVAMLANEKTLVIGNLSELAPPMIGINPSLFKASPKLHWATVSFSRGCPYNCSFCYGVKIHGHKLFKKDANIIAEELKDIHKATGCPNFYVSDLCFGIDKKYTHKIADKLRGKGYSLVALCRLELGDDPDLVDELKEAGFSDFLFGIESLSEDVLSSYKKKIDASLQSQRIKVFSKKGLAIHGSFVFGVEGQTYEDVMKAADWSANNEVSYVCFAIYTDYPYQDQLYGTKQLFPDWCMIQSSPAYQHYSYVSVFPKSMRPSKLQRTVIQAYKSFLTKRLSTNEYSPRMRKIKMWGRNMKYTTSRMEEYAQYLEKVEKPYYNSNDQLLEDILREEYYLKAKDNPRCFENMQLIRN